MIDVEVVELCAMNRSALYRWWSWLFVRPLLYLDLVAGIGAVGGWAAGLFFQLSGTVELLLWAVPLTVLVTSVVVGFFYVNYPLLVGTARRYAPGRAEPGAKMNARPHIRFLGWETTEAPLTVTTEGRKARISSRPWLTRATFANEPDPLVSGVTAYQVAGHIEFYDASRDRFLFGMVGQWSEGTGEEIHAVTTSQIDMIPDARPYYLDLVLKYDGDDECYGMNNDTAVRAPADWRDNQRSLGHGFYTIKVMAHGTNMTETFWFGLINRGSGRRVRILRISS